MTTRTADPKPTASVLSTEEIKVLLHAIFFTPGRRTSKGVVTHDTTHSDEQWVTWHTARYGEAPSPEAQAARHAASQVVWGMPLLALGAPGTGKTSVGEALAEVKGLMPNTIIGSQKMPEDIGGYPVPNRTRTSMDRLPDTWVERVNASVNGSAQIFDELTTSDPSMGAAMLAVFSDRAAGVVPLANRVRLVAFGNRSSEAPNARDLTPAEANRFVHCDWAGSSPDEWGEWLLGSSVTPVAIDPNVEEARVLEAWPVAISRASAMVAGYIKRNGDVLHQMPSFDDPQASRGWASHRSWEMVTLALAGSMVHSLPATLRHAWVGGLVSPAHADAFLTWVDRQDLPSPQEVLEAADPVAVAGFDKKRPDRTMLILESCAGYVIRANDPDAEVLKPALYSILGHVADANPEIATRSVMTILKSGRGFDATKDDRLRALCAGSVGKVAVQMVRAQAAKGKKAAK